MEFTVCVFCGSRSGQNPNWASAAQELGCEIASHAWRLVFGGGGRGLMGEVAQGALSCQGKVIGIIPGFLTEAEPVIQGITELHVVHSMVQRKEMVIELSDAFVVLPGGIGTFEELFEVWTGNHIKAYTKPIILVNLDGFYDGLLAFANEVRSQGFLIDQHLSHLKVVTTISEAIELLQKEIN